MSTYVDFAKLKERITIEQVFSMLDVTLKQKGDQWRGPCPTCNSGGDRALVVTKSKQAFYCFASRKGGDMIALVAHIQDVPVKDAALAIAEHTGTGTVPRNGTSSRGTVPQKDGGKASARTLQPLAYLQAAHELVQALGLDPATC